MSRCKEGIDLDSVDEALGRLLTAQLRFGKEAIKVISEGCEAAFNAAKKIELPLGESCCAIPEPCWMPENIGEICCELRPGETGEICFVVSNDDFIQHEYEVFAAGEHAAIVSIDRTRFVLGPKERRVVSARFTMPLRQRDPAVSCCKCNDFEAVIWIKGCRYHYLNWYLNSSAKSTDCCSEVFVNDKPDYELHWYDHFHVYRPCFGAHIDHTSNSKVE